jgi:hypothetical protein
MVRSGKPVTIQVTTAPANARPAQCESGSATALNCTDATQPDPSRRDDRPCLGRGLGFESPELHQLTVFFELRCSRSRVNFQDQVPIAVMTGLHGGTEPLDDDQVAVATGINRAYAAATS